MAYRDFEPGATPEPRVEETTEEQPE
jgi:hypothetical protein